MSSDHIERELRFGGVDHDQLRSRLLELEAESQGSAVLEDNWIFDRDGELGEKNSLLRLRVDKRGAYLTFKGPAHYEDRMRIRLEHETGVDSVENTRAILEALGYSLVRRYQKYRERWLLGSMVIALDRTPIGDFVELEGEGSQRIASRLGLDLENAERRNYLRLYEDYLAEHPDAPPDMVFP